MNKQNTSQGDTAIRRITLVGTASLLAMLFLFVLVTLSSTSKLASQIKLLSEHPFTVNGDVGDITTNLALMRIRTERLQSYNQPADVETVRAALDGLCAETEALLEEIGTLYLGPAKDTASLQGVYEKIREGQALLLAFAVQPATTTDMIAAYELELLSPLYEAFASDSQRILSFVRNTQQNIFTSAEHMNRTTLMWSVIITATMAASLFYFQFTIRRMNQRLYNKTLQFKLLSETVDESFLIFEKGHKECEFVSGSAEKVLGLPARLLQKDRTAAYPFISRGAAEELCSQVDSGDKSIWDTSLEYRHPQSTELRWLHLRLYRVAEGGGTKFIMTLADRTEERRASQALKDALSSAQNANSAKRDFLSRMSHEIRTPMNAIIGMAAIAAASAGNRARVEDCLGKISYSSKHLLMLINDVLDMSRIESSRMKLNREPFEFYQFLNTFVSVVYPQATAKGLNFTEKAAGFSEHTTYLGDPLRLNQILLNLTSNAIKFTPGGGAVSLQVTQLPFRGKQRWLRFVVSDTGIGMDDDALSRLFTPFEQADPSIAGKYGGTGLGMSIAQNLVSLMEGHIDVKSQPGQGTTFTVELPFELSGVDLQPIQECALESLHVLVADNEQHICEHTALLLEKMKIHAEWVLSGTEAVEHVASAQESGNSFDVCFIDWMMPDMDGIKTTRRIRELIGWETPIIIISAYDWSNIEQEARAAGANSFITKPLFQSSLYNALVNVTNGSFRIAEETITARNDTLAGKRLLLAEDNALNMEIAVTLLEMNGACVEGVENGRMAVDRFLQEKPDYYDAILLDVQMPVMDGCEAARQIRGCGRPDAGRIPIIAATANAFTEDVSMVLSAGMDAHISKPLDIAQLCTVLTQLCADSGSRPDVPPTSGI